MMKKILVAAVLVFTLCCCEQRKVAREMKAFMEAEIRFTDDIFKVEDRPVFVGNPLMSHELMDVFRETLERRGNSL